MTADVRPLELTGRRVLHVVNVGGAGMSAIATVLAQMGHEVTGTDARDTPFLAPLRELGVSITIGERRRPTVGSRPVPDAVITSTATPADHPDVEEARAIGAPVAHRGDALEAICAERQVLAVAGTHGKTTSSAMLATIFDGVGDGAGFLVGTRVTGLGTNADWRRGPRFVVEGDESDGTFLRLGAHSALVTNLEADHLSYWGSEEALVDAFATFAAALDGPAVLCLDDPGAARLLGAARRPVTYGTTAGADYAVRDVGPAGIGVRFRLAHGGESVTVTVPAAPGVHNARNAAGAIALAHRHGVALADAAAALGSFRGVARRFELRGTVEGITFVDSYDHLPTEVAAALAAARTGPFERIVCVFQPHRYTRTRDLASTFADAFVDADVLGFTELYPAGEEPVAGVSGRLVLDAVAAAHPEARPHWLGDLGAATEWLVDTLRPGDLCLTLNAGDLTEVPDRVMAGLHARSEGRSEGGS